MISERQAQVLATLVEEYIRTGEPVSSSSILERGRLGVSSATVRNDLAVLDREGYEGPADLAIIGSAGEVEERIRGMADAGVTTFGASEFGDRDQRGAARELLISML